MGSALDEGHIGKASLVPPSTLGKLCGADDMLSFWLSPFVVVESLEAAIIIFCNLAKLESDSEGTEAAVRKSRGALGLMSRCQRHRVPA